MNDMLSFHYNVAQITGQFHQLLQFFSNEPQIIVNATAPAQERAKAAAAKK